MERRLRELLADAAAHHGEARAAFLAARCPDATARAELDRLLADLDRAGPFLLEPPTGFQVRPVDVGPGAEAGQQIGPYRLVEPIGYGGFGEVWLAEQQEPVRRRVAVKLIRPGMDTEQVIHRFEQERQTLALLDHPHIARVFDAGTSPGGRPYFAMELVKGIPITDYCLKARVALPVVLALFVQTCRAVAHAHQRGIVHRDLKPTNLLVTQQDGEPLVKVIDFGIAKATGGNAHGRTALTTAHQWLGTPDYMAPEQVVDLDIDTRADIYALGAVLYELLTGTPPLQLGMVEDPEALLRAIRDQDPPRPSTRVVQFGSHRTPGEIMYAARLLRGDLDWIVMRALEKDRQRRYQTVDAFAHDALAFLDHRPVSAGPPSGFYRLRKYVRRHRVGVVMAVAVSSSLVVGLALALAGWDEARAEAQRAELAAQQSAQASREAEAARTAAAAREQEALAQLRRNENLISLWKEALRNANPQRAPSADYTMERFLADALAALDRQPQIEPLVEAELRNLIACAFLALRKFAEATKLGRRVLDLAAGTLAEDSLVLAKYRSDLAAALGRGGQEQDHSRLAEAEVLLRLALPTARAHCDEEPFGLGAVLLNLGTVQVVLEHFDDAERSYREALPLLEADGWRPELAYAGLAEVAGRQGRRDEELQFRRDAVAAAEGAYGPDDRLTVEMLDKLVVALQRAGDTAAVAALQDRIVAIGRRNGIPRALFARRLLDFAMTKSTLGENDAAREFAEEAVALWRELDNGDPQQFSAKTMLAGMRAAREGPTAATIELTRDAAIGLRAACGGKDPRTFDAELQWARLLQGSGALAEAEPLMRRLTDEWPADTPQAALATHDLAMLLLQLARPDDAAAMFERAIPLLASVAEYRHRQIGSMMRLAALWHGSGRSDGAELLLREVLAVHREAAGVAGTMSASAQLASLLLDRGRAADAEPVARETVGLARTLPPQQAPAHRYGLLWTRALRQLGRPAEAAAAAREAAAGAMARADTATQHEALVQLAHSLQDQGEFAEATAVGHERIALARTAVPGQLALDLADTAALLVRQSQWREAEPLLREALPLLEVQQPPVAWRLADARSRLGEVVLEQAPADPARQREAGLLLTQAWRDLDPPPDMVRELKDAALRRLVRLAEAQGDAAGAERWRAERQRLAQ